MAFSDVEDVLGLPLPPSARNHLPHWYGYEGTALGRAIRDAGWRASGVNLTAERVTFVRAVDWPQAAAAKPARGNCSSDTWIERGQQLARAMR
ncbi:hypothetical protein Q6348_13915 [Isoptericola sp. b441]|uniref:DUF7662 domain-containing protein n=1 Tax=Actinotalea lenta TaxID=3064654 RepID=A0ABT9DBN2_9CELL|nr:hypothetical protein [Isoptericola sp. b441]MDO8108292.1 hypothetical protein [Isoptericola sp. b441]